MTVGTMTVSSKACDQESGPTLDELKKAPPNKTRHKETLKKDFRVKPKGHGLYLELFRFPIT